LHVLLDLVPLLLLGVVVVVVVVVVRTFLFVFDVYY
jgi:hypothetical protein